MKASARENTAPALECGGNVNWLLGNIVIDRNRFNQDRKFGVSIAGGRVVFGVSGDGSGDRTICGFSDVLDDHWHHVAVERRRADGWMWLYVDGTLEAEANGPDGDISYPDDGVPGDACGAPCVESDPFLVLGAAKHGAGGQSRSYSGWLDEIRLSHTLRYTSQFTRPTAPFVPDADTAALYHLDEGIGDVITDSSQAPGGPSHGARDFGGAPAGPAWSTDTPPLDHPAVALLAIATSLAKPVAIAHAGDGSGRLFIVLQEGRIVIHDGQGVLPEPFLDVRALVSCCGELGLLGLAFHPGYAGNGYFFVNYTDLTGATVIARYSVSASDPDSADPNSAVILLTILQPFSNHNGGQLKFGPDGYLYIGMGDGGSGGDPQNNAQNLGSLLGKMLRIDVDGVPRYAVPPDNPFVTTPGARPEIWALGLRNPWRFTFDRATGDLFIGDVGQDRWEEISFQPAASPGGENFGWRLMEGTHCFNPETSCNPGTLTLPIIEYSHALGCSVTGGYRYRGRQVPEFHGTYLYADFCSGRLWGASQDGGGQWSTAELLDTALLISTFGEDEAGELYLAHRPDDATGAVYRITHPSPHAVPAVTGLTPATVIAGGPSFTLRVGGAGFASSSVVRWNGQDRPTTFVSDTQLSAKIPGTDIAAAGTGGADRVHSRAGRRPLGLCAPRRQHDPFPRRPEQLLGVGLHRCPGPGGDHCGVRERAVLPGRDGDAGANGDLPRARDGRPRSHASARHGHGVHRCTGGCLRGRLDRAARTDGHHGRLRRRRLLSGPRDYPRRDGGAAAPRAARGSLPASPGVGLRVLRRVGQPPLRRLD